MRQTRLDRSLQSKVASRCIVALSYRMREQREPADPDGVKCRSSLVGMRLGSTNILHGTAGVGQSRGEHASGTETRHG